MNKKDYTEIIDIMTSEIIASIREIVDKEAKYDVSFKCQVVEKVNDKKYKVLYHGKTHTVSSSIPCNVGDFVWVCAPKNNWSDLFVVCRV